MQPIRLLHTADIHVGMENHGRVDPATGINSRVMDFLRRLSDLGDYAIDNDVDIIVFAGDAYRTRDPNPTYQREFARRIKHIADAGIPVILLVGNHDLPAVAKRATSVEIFDVLDVPNVYVGDREQCIEITCRRGQRLQVAMAPYPLRSSLINREDHRGKSLEELDAELEYAMTQNLSALAGQAAERAEVPAILVGHFSVHTALLGSEQKIMIGRDAHVPPHTLKNPAWRYVALGHIHKHQNLNPDNNPPVVYSGSIERIDFGEEGEEKGFVVAEIDGNATRWQFVTGYRRQARPFRTIDCDVRERPDCIAAVLEAVAAAGDLSESIVRLNITARPEQEMLLADREIAHALEHAYYISGINKQIERSKRDRLGGVSIEELTPIEAFRQYLQTRNMAEDHAALLLKQAAAVMEEVDGQAG
jgi:DNA repair protein SbcD/Mre11